MKRIQFCAGGNRLADFENHDSDVNIEKPLPFPNSTYDFAFIEHGIEHTDMRHGFLFMEEVCRILKPGGVFRICVPILDRIADKAHCRDLIVGNGHQAIYSLPTIVTMLQLAGFETVSETGRNDCDGHHRVIGIPKDDIESLRVEAVKAK